MISRLFIVVQIAFRNLVASRINLVLGALILVGTLLFLVIGGALGSLSEAMSRSVVGSLAGHIQVYSASSKDELSVFGGMGGDPELAAMTDFPRVRAELSKVPNVKTVVPMGVSVALVTSGNIVDVTLERLRSLEKARDGTGTDPALAGLSKAQLDERIAAQKDHVRQIIRVLDADSKKVLALLSDRAVEPEVRAALERVNGDAFWAQFDADPYGSLEFLENKIAPQVTDSQMIGLRYLGTDLDAFQRSFDRMEIVDGSPVPKGQRGFLIPKFQYEEQMKLRSARRLDKIRAARGEGQRLIATDDELKRFVKENRSQTKDIVLQLDGPKTKETVQRLQALLGSSEEDLGALLGTFFDTDDATFDARYDFFYQQLAPLLQLYRVRIGDSLTIKAFGRGSVQSVNVKVYGTFAFKGLEKSPLAGTTSLMDLMSFRDLYGYLTTDRKEELAELQRAVGVKPVNRDNAEAELFGEGSGGTLEATAVRIELDDELTGTARKSLREDLLRRVYSQEEIDTGVVMNAAVILEDPDRLDETIAAIEARSRTAGLNLRAVSWQQASGILGQVITFVRWLMIGSVIIIFGIAIVIINNAMMMATLQRTQLIGTMRAIGAQRPLILGMVLTESIVLGVVFGGGGVALGAAIMALWHEVGTGATNDATYFLFSGSRLYPSLSTSSLVIALSLILAVTIVSTLFPAFIATRVSPLRAMQADE